MEQTFTGIIENGNIYKIEYAQKTVIGVTADVYTQLKDNAEKALNRNEELAQEKDKYYNMLIEHGIIQKPKSTEDRILDLEKTNNQILNILEKINSTLDSNIRRMEVLENEFTKPNSNGKNNGDRTRQNKSSSTNDE